MPNSALSTPQEAAEYLKIRESTVAALARRGELPYVWIGNRRIRRFRRADLDAFIAARRVRSKTSNADMASVGVAKSAVTATDHELYRAA